MNSVDIFRQIRSIFLIITIIIASFVGIMVFEGILDKGGVDAVTIRYVGDDSTYKSISAAILDSFPGDVIYVKNGIYLENVVVNRPGISVIGNSTENTIINGNGVGDVMRITQDDVNVSGFTLVNSGKSDPPTYDCGIELSGVSNVTITNVNSSHNSFGIYLDTAGHNTIRNSTLYANGYDGIFTFFGNNNIFRNNTCINNVYSGIYIYNSDGNILQENICKWNNWYGIWLDFSAQNDVTQNLCYNNNESGIFLQVSGGNTLDNNVCGYNLMSAIECYVSGFNTLSNNICLSNNGLGITMVSSLNQVLTGNSMYTCGLYIDGNTAGHWNSHTIDSLNTVNDRSVRYWKFQTGGTIPANAGQVILTNCTNVKIDNQLIYNTPVPIELAFSDSNLIELNNITNNIFGIVLFNSDSNTITNNSCTLNFYSGLSVLASHLNTILSNDLARNYGNGLLISNSNNNTISGVTMKDNEGSGAYLFNSKTNLFNFNTFLSNTDYGIFLNGSIRNTLTLNNITTNEKIGIKMLNSDNNHIYFNNILHNTVQGEEDSGSDNNWDNGMGEGNYWSDYSGLDNGAGGRTQYDGIGDTKLPHLGLDNYPFVNQTGWQYPGIPGLIDPGDLDTDGNYTVKWNKNRGTLRYQLEEDTDSGFGSPTILYEGPNLSLNISGKPNGTYYYRLKAFSEKYESPYSSMVDIIVNWFPAVPRNFKVASYPGGDALNLSWDINDADTQEYELYWNHTGSWIKVASINHPDHMYNHTGLDDGIRYYYKIRARDSLDQFSEYSSVISGVPGDLTAPAPPAGLKVVAVQYNSITLEWKNNTEADVQGYNIYRGNISNPDAWGDLVGTTGVGEVTFTDTGLTELTNYVYRVAAFDEVPWESSLSEEASAKTRLGPHGPEVNNTYVDLIGDVTISEDSYVDNKINLYRLFRDANNDDLEFNVSGANHIVVKIYQDNGTVVLIPEPNWNGQEELNFSATDGIFDINFHISITVTGVNDPPGQVTIISPSEGIETTSTKALYFEAECTDLDLDYGDSLTYEWASSVSGFLATGQNVTNIDLSPGLHMITVEVKDNEGKTSRATINITVLEKKEVTDDLMGIMLPVIAIIIILIIFIMVLLVIGKQKKAKEESPEEPVMVKEPPGVSADIYAPGMEPGPEAGVSQPVVVKPSGETLAAGTVPPVPGEPASAREPLSMDMQYYPELPPAETSTQTDEIAPFIDYSQYIDWGRAYVIITKESMFGLDIFEKHLEKEIGWGLCISRTHPGQLKSSMIMDGVKKIWLSQAAEEFSISPSNLTKIAHAITEFLKTNEKCIILLDGLEYLLNNNDFQKVLKFIESVHEKIVLNKAVLMISINPSTMSKQDFEVLEKELGNTIKDPYYNDD